MDLQLGLALPTTLNSHAFDPNDLFSTLNSSDSSPNKRSFSHILYDLHNTDDHAPAQLLPTLPLLPLTPSHEDYDLDDHSNTSCSVITKNDGDDGESAAVGWPPIMSQRKKLRFEGDGMVGIHHKRTSWDPVRESNALYLKVKMEGEGIGRKVDLRLHHSFQNLKETLIAMFGKCHHHPDCYELAYQDREGDWLLAEDLPWKNFVQCAQRLKLLKKE